LGVTVKYIEKDTFIHRLSPITKMIFLAAVLIVSLSTLDLVVITTMFVVVMIFWFSSRIGFGLVRDFLRLLVVFLLYLSVLLLLFYSGGNRTVVFTLPRIPLFIYDPHAQSGPFGVITRGALSYTYVLAMRVLCIVFSLPVLTMTTTAGKMVRGLSLLKLPYPIAFVLVSAMNFTPMVFGTYDMISDAQKLRAYDRSKVKWSKRLREGGGFLPIIIPMLLLLLRKTTSLNIAMQTRAYGTPRLRTYVERADLTLPDFLVLALMVSFAIMVIALRLMQIVFFSIFS
jgi:energy-coupling factor transport system permease protein